MNKEHIHNVLQFKPSGFDPYVEQHREDGDSLEYTSWDKFQQQEHVDERSVLPNEVVIDIDEGDTEERRDKTRQVCTLLQGLPYFVADTGGTGFHIHLFFQVPSNIDEAHDLRSYRMALFDWIRDRIDNEAAFSSDALDAAPVDFDTATSKGHLIRAVGGRHSETGHRKTKVTPSSLDKDEVEDADEVDYPVLDKSTDFIRMSKLDSKNADLSWSEVQNAAAEYQEKTEERREKQLETDYEAADDGLDAVRQLPADEVLKLLGRDVPQGQEIKCPCHDDSNPSAKITDGTEAEGVEPGLLFCWSGCVEDGESGPHVNNAIDILTENGYSFQEAKQELADEFDIDLNQVSNRPSKYFDKEQHFQPAFLYRELESSLEFVYSLVEHCLYYYEEGKYVGGNGLGERKVATECRRRLGDEYRNRRKREVLDAIESAPGIGLTQDEFKPPRYKINFQNGTYDIMDEELHGHSPEHMFTQQIPYDYDPDASCPNINSFLKEITETEEEARTLKELVGYAMLPNMEISAAFLLVGEGQNGKTMFINLLKEAVGSDHIKDEELQHLESSRFGTQSLYRKLAVVSDDLSDTKLETGDTLKALTGGGDVRAEIKNGGHFEFQNYATPIFACNQVPKTDAQKDAFFRRWTLIDFPYKFVENPVDTDPRQKERKPEFQLRKEIFNEEELKGLVSEAVDAVVDVFKRQSFTAQQTPEETRKKWNSYADPIMEFIYNYVEQGRTQNKAEKLASQEQTDITQFDFDYIPKDELFQLVSAYCKSHNARPPKSKHHLKQKLEQAGLYFSLARTTQVQTKEDRTRVYGGLCYSDEMKKAVQNTESFRGFLTFLGIQNARAYKRDARDAHTRLEMKIGENPGTPGRIEPKAQIKQQLRDLGGGENGEPVNVADLAEAVDVGGDVFEEKLEELDDEGVIYETNPGKVQFL